MTQASFGTHAHLYHGKILSVSDQMTSLSQEVPPWLETSLKNSLESALFKVGVYFFFFFFFFFCGQNKCGWI